MNLIDLYNNLLQPDNTGQKRFSATCIPGCPDCRVAMDNNGNPALLLSVSNPTRNLGLKNFRFSRLSLLQNQECVVFENEKEHIRSFTIITFTEPDHQLQEYFFRVAETFTKIFQQRKTTESIVEAITNFVEVFRLLDDSPKRTIQGLWSELFLIERASMPEVLIQFWHETPEEKFDFNSGQERIEVKSTVHFERVHTFSAEQLNPPANSQVIIASIFTKSNSSGASIHDLITNISLKIRENQELIGKLNMVVSRSLGDALQQALSAKYDYNVAKNSLKLYWHQDVKKIEKISIPNEVSNVKFKSDLSNATSIMPSQLSNKGILYSGL